MFQELVLTFSSLLERCSDYLGLCQASSALELAESLYWKERSNQSPPPSPPPLARDALPDIQEQEGKEEEDDDDF